MVGQGNAQAAWLRVFFGPGINFLNTIVQIPVQIAINVFA
jgi:hypothetical protein